MSLETIELLSDEHRQAYADYLAAELMKPIPDIDPDAWPLFRARKREAEEARARHEERAAHPRNPQTSRVRHAVSAAEGPHAAAADAPIVPIRQVTHGPSISRAAPERQGAPSGMPFERRPFDHESVRRRAAAGI